MFVHYNMPREPITEEEKEAVQPFSLENGCNVYMEEFYCTRSSGHTGKHIAGGPSQIYAEWNDED